MSTTAPVAAKANGLSTVINTIAAPSEAFESLRVAPTWGWALVFTIVLMVIGAYLQGPATRHAGMMQTQQMMNTSSLFASLTPAQKAAAVARAGQPSPWPYLVTVIVLFIAVLFNTVIVLIGNAVGRGQADFKRLWCGSMNIAVPTVGLGGVVLGIITMLRAPDTFNNSLDIARAMPSLAWLVPGGSPSLIAFGSAISIFTLWGLFLNATMLRVTAKTSTGVAYGFAALITLLGGLLFAAFASFGRGFGMG